MWKGQAFPIIKTTIEDKAHQLVEQTGQAQSQKHERQKT